MNKLANAMKREGVTIEDVAALVGHKPATVARWMVGEGRGFTLQMICGVRDAFFQGLSIEELV